MKNLRLWNCGILALAIGVCAGCTTIKYVAPIVIKDGVQTGGETFELKKRFVLAKVTGFKVDRKNDGSVKASFDTVENTDSKAIDALADLAKIAIEGKTKAP